MTHKEALQACDKLIKAVEQMKKSIEADMNTPVDPLAKKMDDIISKLGLGQQLDSGGLKPKVPQVNPREALEKMQAQQLANRLQKAGILGTRPPPRQPTDQELFGGLVPSEEQLQKAEEQYKNPFGWMTEATKPIASRFKTPEEEQAYWDSIKISDKGGGDFGY
jgi:hypothetical protein